MNADLEIKGNEAVLKFNKYVYGMICIISCHFWLRFLSEILIKNNNMFIKGVRK